MWVPNSLHCWLLSLSIKTQSYKRFDPVDKALDSCGCHKMGVSIYIVVALTVGRLRAFFRFKFMSRKQLAQVIITLRGRGRATFVNVSCLDNGFLPSRGAIQKCIHRWQAGLQGKVGHHRLRQPNLSRIRTSLVVKARGLSLCYRLLEALLVGIDDLWMTPLTQRSVHDKCDLKRQV